MKLYQDSMGGKETFGNSSTMAPPSSSAPSSSKSTSTRSASASAKSPKDQTRDGSRPVGSDPADPVLPDFSSLVPHHLDVLEGLPTNLRYLYSKITDLQQELDSQLDHLHASTTAIHASIRDRIVSTNYRAGVKVDMHMAANQAFSHLAGTTIQQCQRTAQRKVDLATYAYELVDRCVLKLDEELKAAGLPIQDAYPVILAAVSSSSGGSGASASSAAPAAASGAVTALAQVQPPVSPRKAAHSAATSGTDAHASTGGRSSRKRSRASTPLSEHPTVQPSYSVSPPEKPKKADKKQKSTAAANSSSISARKASAPKTAKRKSSARDTPTDDGADEDADASSSDAAAEHFSTPVDPNEPLYCTCQSVAHGEMVACDDSDCPYEWFHYACVGLTKAPKGQWYCSECALKKKRQKRH